MEWHFEQKEAFLVTALERRLNDNTGFGVPQFYREYKEKYSSQIPARLGICEFPEASFDWTYAIGDITDKTPPEGFIKIAVPAQGWAVFSGSNANEIYNYVYGQWFITGSYEILPAHIIEVYDDDGVIRNIWIPVKKKH